MLIKNFQYYGFDVIYSRKKPFSYTNNYERACNFIRKNFLNDKSYKDRKQEAVQLEHLINTIDAKLKIKNEQLIDYALFIRADLCSLEFIQAIKNKSKKTINYQWDGLSRYPDIFERMDLFDRFMIFDAKDKVNYPQYPLHLSSNFYFDCYPSIKNLQSSNKLKMYFLGSHIPERVPNIVQFLSAIKHLPIDYQFLILGCYDKIKEQQDYHDLPVTFINSPINFEENLIKVQNSNILVDFVNNVHSGLSFRVFEALCYQKKLITNNTEILRYDFYHADNIFIFDENTSTATLENFFNTPYKPLAKDIYQKYAFANWLKYTLDIHPHQSLNFLH